MLTADQCRSLQCLAEMMIPASVEYGVPSAGDDAILADILQSVGRDAEHVIAVLRTLDATAGGPFADMDPQLRNAIAAQLRETGGEGLTSLTRIILQCYYRDDRVMRSLGMEPRPPFPKRLRGGTRRLVPLDPVRAPEALSRHRLTEIGSQPSTSTDRHRRHQQQPPANGKRTPRQRHAGRPARRLSSPQQDPQSTMGRRAS
jgi:hypothetical protein